MPASKTDQYSLKNKQLAILARALAHPARIRMVEILRMYGSCRNTDFTGELTISKNSVHNHLVKLKDAGLIRFHFNHNSFFIYLNEQRFGELKQFLLGNDC